MTSSELALGSTQTPMKTALLAGEAHVLLVGVGAEHHVGDVVQADERAALLADDEVLELVDRCRGRCVAVRLIWTSAPFVCPTAAR